MPDKKRQLDSEDIEVWMAAADEQQPPARIVFSWGELEELIESLRKEHPTRAKHAAKVLGWVRREAVKRGYTWAMMPEDRL